LIAFIPQEGDADGLLSNRAILTWKGSTRRFQGHMRCDFTGQPSVARLICNNGVSALLELVANAGWRPNRPTIQTYRRTDRQTDRQTGRETSDHALVPGVLMPMPMSMPIDVHACAHAHAQTWMHNRTEVQHRDLGTSQASETVQCNDLHTHAYAYACMHALTYGIVCICIHACICI